MKTEIGVILAGLLTGGALMEGACSVGVVATVGAGGAGGTFVTTTCSTSTTIITTTSCSTGCSTTTGCGVGGTGGTT